MNGTVYIWHTENAPNTCKECKDLDGKIFYNLNDIPPKPHPNCKCRVEIQNQKTGNYKSDSTIHFLSITGTYDALKFYNNLFRNIEKAGFWIIQANNATELQNHFYEGSGYPILLSDDLAKKSQIIQNGIKKSYERIQGITMKNADLLKPLLENTLKEIKVSDYWDNDVSRDNYKQYDDTFFSLGSFKMRTYFQGTAKRAGNKIYFQGKIIHRIIDQYDFDNVAASPNEFFAQNVGTGKPFTILWEKQLDASGIVSVDEKQTLSYPVLKTYKEEYNQ